MGERERRQQQPPADPSGIEEPHDVLAAEEFGIGTRDERFPADPSGIDQPHDVLAAEEFAMPTREERVPADPTGIREPHDVLAAEEFALPAPEPADRSDRGRRLRAWLPPLLLALALVALLLRRRGAPPYG